MTQGPSRIVERFNPSEAQLEECPVCGDSTTDENGAPVFAGDPLFCSSYCRDAHAAEQQHRVDVAATELRGIQAVIMSRNAKCSKCVTSPVYCFHQQ